MDCFEVNFCWGIKKEILVNPSTGPEIWLEYVQYSIGGMGAQGGIERVRSIFERALTAVGLHMTKGTSIWEAYREFEIVILSTVQVFTLGSYSDLLPNISMALNCYKNCRPKILAIKYYMNINEKYVFGC